MKKKKKLKKTRRTKTERKLLRSGSKRIKQELLIKDPHCDICGSQKDLQLHHIYMIRHGFKSELKHCCLLCRECHVNFHRKYDKYLDITFEENPDIDFLAVYNTIKRLS